MLLEHDADMYAENEKKTTPVDLARRMDALGSGIGVTNILEEFQTKVNNTALMVLKFISKQEQSAKDPANEGKKDKVESIWTEHELRKYQDFRKTQPKSLKRALVEILREKEVVGNVKPRSEEYYTQKASNIIKALDNTLENATAGSNFFRLTGVIKGNHIQEGEELDKDGKKVASLRILPEEIISRITTLSLKLGDVLPSLEPQGAGGTKTSPATPAAARRSHQSPAPSRGAGGGRGV